MNNNYALFFTFDLELDLGWVGEIDLDLQYYLAVANAGGDRHKSHASVIYRWSSKRHRFRVHQELMTYTARDIEYFSIDGLHYLVVANHVLGMVLHF